MTYTTYHRLLVVMLNDNHQSSALHHACSNMKYLGAFLLILTTRLAIVLLSLVLINVSLITMFKGG